MADDAPKPSAKYDLTQTIAPYLDLHLMYPIMQWLGENDMYNKDDLQRATFELCKKTNMIDYAMEIYKGLHPGEDVPKDLSDKRALVIQNYQSLSKAAAPLLQLIEDTQRMKELKADDKFNLQGLAEIGILAEHVEATYDFSKYLMDCGVYDQCLKNLRIYRQLVPEEHERSFQALWGQLVADILSQGEGNLQALYKLREAIDSRTWVSPLEQLQQRTWLLHWSLFVFFNRPDGARLICEFFFQGREQPDRDRRGRRNQQQQESEYVNVIQTNCPWMLRYLAAAVIIQKWRRNMSDLVEVIRQERTNYNDPITQLLEALYVNHDLEGAQVMLRECESVMRSDYFFGFRGDEFIDEFITSARKLIFKKFCLIHQKIDITKLSRQLHMDRDQAEKWMVDLIRNNTTQMGDNAKIDSANSMAIMDIQYPSIYQRIIEKTQDLAERSYELANNLQRARYRK